MVRLVTRLIPKHPPPDQTGSARLYKPRSPRLGVNRMLETPAARALQERKAPQSPVFLSLLDRVSKPLRPYQTLKYCTQSSFRSCAQCVSSNSYNSGAISKNNVPF